MLDSSTPFAGLRPRRIDLLGLESVGWLAAPTDGLWYEALIFGLLSAASLPLGAFLGQRMSPVNDATVSALVAFGAGALLFAVTVELYGHALTEVSHGALGYTEMSATIASAFVGALGYLYLNKKMEHWAEEEDEDDEVNSPEHKEAAGEAAGTASQARWGMVRERTKQIGDEIRKSKVVMSAREAVDLLMKNTGISKTEADKLKGRKKRMNLAMVGAEAGNYGAVGDGRKTPEELAAEEEEERKTKAGMKLAQAMFLGLLVDGIPESILLGFLAAERSLSLVLVISLFVANFPEAFSSASLMKAAKVPVLKIVGMWTGLCLLTGVLSAASCWGLLFCAGEAAQHGALPFHIELCAAIVEGIAGGAMIACIASVMLPEAFERRNTDSLLWDSGFLCTAGFLTAVAIKVLGGYVDTKTVADPMHGAPGAPLPHTDQDLQKHEAGEAGAGVDNLVDPDTLGLQSIGHHSSGHGPAQELALLTSAATLGLRSLMRHTPRLTGLLRGQQQPLQRQDHN